MSGHGRSPLPALLPLIPAAASMACGISMAHFFPDIAITGLVIAAVAGIVLHMASQRAKSHALAVAAVCMPFIAAGIATQLLNTPKPATWLYGKEVSCSGVVDEVYVGYNSQQMLVKVDSIDSQPCSAVNMSVDYRCSLPAVCPGCRIHFIATVERIRPAVNTVPEVRGYGNRYASTAQCSATVGPDNLTAIFYLDNCRSWLYDCRQRFSGLISASGMNRATAAFVRAILMADRSAITSTTREAFASAGISHVLALSGTHVAIIALLISLLLYPLRLVGRYKLELCIMLLVLWGYVLFAGAPASVVRASIMVSMVACSRLLDCGNSSMNALCLAAILILIFSPQALFEPGFQMSFTAVAFIIMFNYRPTRRLPHVVAICVQWLVMCTAAVAGTAPLSAWHFHTLPMLFIPANIVVALILPLFMTCSVVLLVFAAAGIKFALLAGCLDLMYGSINLAAEWVESIPGAVIGNLHFSAWMLVPYYLAALWLWMALRTRNRAMIIGSALVAAFAMLLPLAKGPEHYPDTEVYPLDLPFSVGILVKDVDTAIVLTDCRPKYQPELAEQLAVELKPFIESRGLKGVGIADFECRTTHVEATARRWRIGATHIAFLVDASDTLVHQQLPHPTYAVISRYFRGDAVRVAVAVGADTVIISPELAERYAAEAQERLTRAGIVCRRSFRPDY